MRPENARWPGWFPVRIEWLCRASAAVVLTGSLELCLAGAAAAGSLLVHGPAGATVSVSGRAIGTLPISDPLTLEPGIYTVRCEMHGYRPFETDAIIGGEHSSYVVVASMEPFDRSTALARSLVFAGLGQHYLDRPRLGWALVAIEAGGLAAGLAGEIALRDRSAEYDELYDAYQHAVSEPEIAAAKEAADEAWTEVEDAADLRRTGLIVAGCAVGVGVLDTLLRFPGVEAGPTELQAHGLGAIETIPGVRVAWAARF